MAKHSMKATKKFRRGGRFLVKGLILSGSKASRVRATKSAALFKTFVVKETSTDRKSVV